MIIFLKNGESYEIDQHTKNDYDRLRKKTAKEKMTETFTINGEDYTLHDIRFIGDWCHNEKCDAYEKSGIKAHPEGVQCEYDYSGSCMTCSKKMWRRDCDYSKYLFDNIYCAKHIPDHDIHGHETNLIKKI